MMVWSFNECMEVGEEKIHPCEAEIGPKLYINLRL
jgi:hypothetical protein